MNNEFMAKLMSPSTSYEEGCRQFSIYQQKRECHIFLDPISKIHEHITTTPCSETYLKSVINMIDVKTLYQHQQLSLQFIFDYILNPEYHGCDEDSYITIDDILPHQTHTKEDVAAFLQTKNAANLRPI